MKRNWLLRLAEIATVAVTMTAILKELEKPEEDRKWYGKVGFVPYDFRMPTFERIKERLWNRFDNRIVTPEVFGIGWAINLHALLDNLRLIGEEDVSEEDFLMPTQSMKELLVQSAESK
jgi:hypothetical protein